MAFEEMVDRAWAEMLGCPVEALARPGWHVTSGGVHRDLGDRLLVARVRSTTLVACPPRLEERAARELAAADERSRFSAAVAARIAGVDEGRVFGPSCQSFADESRFVGASPVGRRPARRLDADDPLLGDLREAVGEDDWAEGGFFDDPATYDGELFAIEEAGALVAAGNLTPFLGAPADVGLVTRSDARGRGLATSLAATMVAGALEQVPLVRYRALATNEVSLRIARSLGFVERGRTFLVRLPA